MSREIGFEAEEFAADFLRKSGFKILGKNISYTFGELDLVVQKNSLLVFVEVKARKDLLFGHPYEWVTRDKQKKIILAAKAYLAKFRGDYLSCRFDVISMVGTAPKWSIDHIEGAFSLEDY